MTSRRRPGMPSAGPEEEDVEYTISKDYSRGLAAQAESSYSVLEARDPAAELAWHASLVALTQMNGPPLSEGDHRCPRRPDEDQSWTELQVSDDANPKPDATPIQASATVAKLPDNQRHLVLHRVSCSAGVKGCDRQVYREEPSKLKIKGVMHLAGGTAIDDLDEYLGAHPQLYFVVYRDYQCGKNPHPRLVSTIDKFDTRLAAKFMRETLCIISEDLQTDVRAISRFSPNHDPRSYRAQSLTSLLTKSPSEYTYYFLYHHRDRIHSAAAERNNNIGPLAALSTFLRGNPDPMYEKCDALFGQNLVSAETLPWLFQVNEPLVSTDGNLKLAYVLARPAEVLDDGRITLSVWKWGYDGHSLRRSNKELDMVFPVQPTALIGELPIHPIQHASEEVKRDLFQTGERFWELRGHNHVAYQGLDYKGEREYPWDSRCMVDYQTYRRFHPAAAHFNALDFTSGPAGVFDPWPKTIDRDSTLTAIQTMLLPPGIHGFLLGEKKWVQLLVDNIKPINWNKEAFEKLVLPPRMKNTVQALVTIRKLATTAALSSVPDTRRKRDDIIRNKGKGLIMLLHGGPGTGKTLTAESVAELAEMPLYSVTCGDIGTSPASVEKYLDSVLLLGKEWNCVLLLDEADVFLEQRSLSDLERNSLVSVFLRILEYYDGVLILTSNRVGIFDEAFKSRIQVALYYPTLDLSSRRQIWQNFLDMLREDEHDVDFDSVAAHMDELAFHEMNGRQIRNAMTTARQLAEFNTERLEWDHICQAIETASAFDKYLRDANSQDKE